MEIKTKSAIGGEVWSISDCKVVCIKIERIIYDGTVVYYCDTHSVIKEQLCFLTKDELLAHISEDGNESM